MVLEAELSVMRLWEGKSSLVHFAWCSSVEKATVTWLALPHAPGCQTRFTLYPGDGSCGPFYSEDAEHREIWGLAQSHSANRFCNLDLKPGSQATRLLLLSILPYLFISICVLLPQ